MLWNIYTSLCPIRLHSPWTKHHKYIHTKYMFYTLDLPFYSVYEKILYYIEIEAACQYNLGVPDVLGFWLTIFVWFKILTLPRSIGYVCSIHIHYVEEMYFCFIRLLLYFTDSPAEKKSNMLYYLSSVMRFWVNYFTFLCAWR